MRAPVLFNHLLSSVYPHTSICLRSGTLRSVGRSPAVSPFVNAGAARCVSLVRAHTHRHECARASVHHSLKIKHNKTTGGCARERCKRRDGTGRTMGRDEPVGLVARCPPVTSRGRVGAISASDVVGLAMTPFLVRTHTHTRTCHTVDIPHTHTSMRAH